MAEMAKKSIELAEVKQQLEEAYKTAAEAKTGMAQSNLEKEQLQELVEQLKQKIFKNQKRDVKKTNSQ